jgi:hypothetical protein
MPIRVLHVAEIVGKAGVFAVKRLLPALVEELKPVLVTGCADGATGGKGLGRQHAGYLKKLGLSILTLGECAFYKKDLVECMDKLPYVLRPANFPIDAPGRGFRIVAAGGARIGVFVLLGQAEFPRLHADNPLEAADRIVAELARECDAIICEYHAATTAERRTMAAYLDGKAALVVGAHGRVQTRDEAISASGTASITDSGMTGSKSGVWGMDPATRLAEHLTGLPQWDKDAWMEPGLDGVLVDIDDKGKATSIRRVSVACPGEASDEGNGDRGKGEAPQD